MHNIKELKIWQRSIELAVAVYKATKDFPQNETYGLTSQIRRASVSISSYRAEGAERNAYNEFKHFLGIANGSSFELETQLIISQRLNLLDGNILAPNLKEIEELQKMNYKLMSSLLEKAIK
jgi:four helix bundle protein